MSNEILYLQDHRQEQEILPPMTPAEYKIRMLFSLGDAIEQTLSELSQEDLRQLRTAQIPSRDGKTFMTGIGALCLFATSFKSVSGNIFDWVETVAFKIGMRERMNA